MTDISTPVLQSIIEVLVTDYCNQNCPFCFARAEMKDPLKKEISLRDIKMIKKQCIKNGILNIALTGGEPTLHSRFIDIVNILKDDFFRIHINTNGSFSDKTAQYLKTLGQRTSLVFNISTPGFAFNKTLRKQIVGRIEDLMSYVGVSLVITSRFRNSADAITLLGFFTDRLLRKVTVRLGVEGVIAGEGNYNRIEDFPLIGPNFMKVFRYVEGKNVKEIRFGKSITPCMFSGRERKYLQKRGYLKTIHCHPEDEGRWFGINPSLETFMCYPLSTCDRLRITEQSDFKKIKRFYWEKQREYEKVYALEYCKKCPFYGLEEGRCPGPCAGFRINAFKK